MPISKNGSGVIIESAMSDKAQFDRTGVIKAADFAICDSRDLIKQIKFDPSAQITNSTLTFASGATVGDVVITLPAASATLVPAASPSFTGTAIFSGKVSIGDSASPTGALTVGSTTSAVGNQLWLGPSAAASAKGGLLAFLDDTGARRYSFGILQNAAETNFTIYDNANSAARLTMTPGGLFGLGIVPSFQLDILSALTGNTAGSNVLLNLFSNGNGYDSSIRFGDGTNASARLSFLSGAMAIMTSGAVNFNVSVTGALRLGATGGVQKHALNSLLATNGAQTATMTNLPAAASAGNPVGWIQMTVNGTDRYMPFW